MDIPFAAVSDIESRWRILDASEEARAEQLLEDASVLIAQEFERRNVDFTEIDATSLLGKALTIVTADMVIRALKSPIDLPSVSQYSQSAIGYSESMTYTNPNGDLYLTKQEKKRLGLSGMRVGVVRPKITGGGLSGWCNH